MDKIDIKSLSKVELVEALVAQGIERYRARQVSKWLYVRCVRSFDDMTDLSKEQREQLKKHFHLTRSVLLDQRSSASDGTTKYLLKLEDGNTVEAVIIPESDRSTICLSSQVGCRFGCTFCASAKFGFVRNLTVSEILDEVVTVKQHTPDRHITNIVFMGIGEPLDNYDNVLKAIRVLNDPDAFGIGARKITISTCGILPGIERLKAENLQIELSVSLHAADGSTRSKLVPINKKYPLHDLIAACKDYTAATNRIVTFEYVMIKGMNISQTDAEKLARLLKGMKCKVNTIAFNQIRAKGYEPPTREDIKAFLDTLKKHGINAIHRNSKGEDIDAGCGQLRISRMNGG